MSVNINLVEKKNPEDSKKEKIKKIKGISFAILTLTAFCAILIFGLDYRFSASYVKKQQTDLLNELSKYDEQNAKIFIINSKLTDTGKILSERKKYNHVTTKIAESLSGVEVEEFQINEAGINMTVSADSLDSIDSFLNSLLDLTSKQVLTSVLMEKLSVEENKYKVKLVMI